MFFHSYLPYGYLEDMGWVYGFAQSLMFILLFFLDIVFSIKKVSGAVDKVKLWGGGLLVFFVWIGLLYTNEEWLLFPDESGLFLVYLVLVGYAYLYRKITIEQVNNPDISTKAVDMDSNILDEDLSDLEELGL